MGLGLLLRELFAPQLKDLAQLGEKDEMLPRVLHVVQLCLLDLGNLFISRASTERGQILQTVRQLDQEEVSRRRLESVEIDELRGLSRPELFGCGLGCIVHEERNALTVSAPQTLDRPIGVLENVVKQGCADNVRIAYLEIIDDDQRDWDQMVFKIATATVPCDPLERGLGIVIRHLDSLVVRVELREKFRNSFKERLSSFYAEEK